MNTNNLGHLKIKLLVEGMKLSEDSLNEVGTRWQEKIYSYSLTDWVDKKILLPSDIKLGGRVYVGFRYNPNSEWELCGDSGKKRQVLNLSTGLKIPAELVPRPSYYDLKTRDGNKIQSIGVSCGNHGLSFFLNSYCEYFKTGENCKFCGLVPTQKRFSDTMKFKSLSNVQEATRAILNSGENLDFIQLSGGSKLDHDSEVRNYLPFITAINTELKTRGMEGKVPIHLTSMPPLTLNILDELKSAGLDTISFDLECPTKEYFDKYCPGKDKSYGYSRMRDALNYALGVFGKGNVFSIVIMGIEPRKSFVKGLEKIMDDGIVPTLNVYHYDPLCSSDMDITLPNAEEIIATAHDMDKLFRKNNAHPGSLGCAHYDIGHEIMRGYFKDAR